MHLWLCANSKYFSLIHGTCGAGTGQHYLQIEINRYNELWVKDKHISLSVVTIVIRV